jgi:nucleoside permease NupC
MHKKFKHLVLNMVQAAMSVPVAYALVNWEWNLLVPLSMINCFQAFFVHSMQYLVQDKEQHRDYLESVEEDKRKLQKDMDRHKSDVDNSVYLESFIKDRWYDNIRQLRLEQRMQE